MVEKSNVQDHDAEFSLNTTLKLSCEIAIL